VTPARSTPADQHFPLTTKEGWSSFVHTQPSEVPLLPDEYWRQLDTEQREDYDRQRFAHHARLIIVATPTVRQVVHAGRRLSLLNQGQISARRGLVVTGAAGTGKTTSLTQLGRSHELLARRRRTGPGPFLPVLYLTVPPACTAKMLAAEFARFLGLPVSKALNQVNITNAVCDQLCRLGTDLVLVDELHNMSLTTRNGAETSDQLKYLSERIPATFVYAGLDIESTGLFNNTRGKQIASRFAVLESDAFPYGTPRQREDWHALVATLEQSLRLHRHRPQALLKQATYLHQRTAGMIGSLSHLIREAAMQAILDGSEAITKTTLSAINLDRAAQDAATTTPRPHRRSRGRKAA
jgi:hypothetical protein